MSLAQRLFSLTLLSFSVLITVTPTTLHATSDPLFYRQWQFEGNSVPSDFSNFNLGVLRAEAQLGLGEENVLMLITDGIKTDHEDLEGAFWTNTQEVPGDGIDNDGNGYIDDIHGINTGTKNGNFTDENGWGTNVAGIIGATVDNGVGIRGIAPNTKIVGCQVNEDFNELELAQQITILNECINYAISLKKNSVNIFAISSTYFEHPYHYFLEVEKNLKLFMQLIEKIEENDFLWINGVPEPIDNTDWTLDYIPTYPLGLNSPNMVAATRLSRSLELASNYGKVAATSVIVGDVMTTTPFDKIESNGTYIFDVTPEDERVIKSPFIDIVEHPDNPQLLAWHIPAFSNDGGQSEIIFPHVDLSTVTTSSLMIDVSLKRNKALNGYNQDGNPIYQKGGEVRIEFRVDDSEQWIYFNSDFLSARGVWDLYTAQLDLERNFDTPILPDSKIQFRLSISGNETYIDGLKVWAIEDGVWKNGYDYTYPPNAGQAILSALAGIIKSHNNDWPAWKIANAITSGGSFDEYVLSPGRTHNTSGAGILSLLNEGEGALDCRNKLLQRRLLPATNEAVFMVVNEELRIRTKSLNCEEPGDAYTLVDDIAGNTFISVDDGSFGDRFAGDGLGILTYQPNNVGKTILKNEFDDNLPVFVFYDYHPVRQEDSSWVDTTDARHVMWQDTENLRLGGLDTDISKSFYEYPFGYLGINTTRQISSEVGANESRFELSINNSNTSNILSTSKFEHPETSNAIYDSNILVDKRLNSFRIYAAPKNTSDNVYTRLHMKGDEGNRQLIAEYSATHYHENQSSPFLQIVFYENKSVIEFNYGDLPNYLEGVEYDIGLEVGRSFRQRRTVTLKSHSSYLLDVDFDFDGIIDVDDPDDDNDGVADEVDAFPYDSAEDTDTDGDGIGNNEDTDDDNDGVNDEEDAFPLNPNEDTDTDGDGVGNNEDTDDDNDGVNDEEDAFPLNPNEDTDTDGDGVGNNEDTDDDNDGVNDDEDAFPLNPNEDTDTDGDGIGNNEDTDDDNDGVNDDEDAFPLNPNEDTDTDGDGIGNNEDTDDDGDGVADDSDAYPLDPSRTQNPATKPVSSTAESGGGAFSSMSVLLLIIIIAARRGRRYHG